MSGQLSVFRVFALAIAILFVAGVERAVAVTYKATIIHPMGYDDSDAKAISGTSILGQGSPSAGSTNGIAFLLDDSTHNVVNLNPDGWYVQPEDVSGNSQVGDGPGPTTGGNPHAVLWHGTPESLVDLNPAGFDASYAFGVSGNNQVGFGTGTATGGPFHALLWHGTAESVVDLNPAGFAASIAFRAFGDNIVGYGQTAQGRSRALLWQGAAHTVVNLHSAAYPETIANDVSDDSQVGQAIFSSNVGGERHALLWHGTAASVIDLNPSGFFETGANAVAGALQVGYGQGTATGGQQHALLWAGSAAGVVDLSSFLVGLGPSFVGSSYASDIDASGVIVGSAIAAVDGNYVVYAVKWTPVPEPSSLTIVGIALVCLGLVLRRSLKPLFSRLEWLIMSITRFGSIGRRIGGAPSVALLLLREHRQYCASMILGSAILLGFAFPALAGLYHADGSVGFSRDGGAQINPSPYSLDLGVQAGGGVNYDSAVLGVHSQANSEADGFGVHAHAYAQIFSPPVSGNYVVGALSTASATFSDMMVTGPVGTTIPTSLNMNLTGGLLYGARADAGSVGVADTQAVISVYINGTFVGAGGLQQNVDSQFGTSIHDTGMLAAWSSGNTGIVTPSFTVQSGVPFEVKLTLLADSNVQVNFGSGTGGTAEANTDFSHTLSFALNGPVFNLPVGYTAGSTDAHIVNNSFVGLPHADYNHDGIVDAADYTVWRDSLGQTGTGLAADGTGPGGVPDGVVDQLDFDFWTANFGNHSGAAASANTAVPEPTTLVLLFVGILSMCCRRLPKVP